jgi:hypothetical protein
MILTGRLGVFRIEKGKLDSQIHGNGNIIPIKQWIAASWDSQELEAIYGKTGRHTYLWCYSTYGTARGPGKGLNPFDVFYMSVRIMDADPDTSDYERPMLTGLLLLPTGKRNGQYRRVGQFELSEHWFKHEKESIEPLTGSTGIMDKRFYMSKHKHGQYTISVV